MIIEEMTIYDIIKGLTKTFNKKQKLTLKGKTFLALLGVCLWVNNTKLKLKQQNIEAD